MELRLSCIDPSTCYSSNSLQWCHNEHDGASNHQRLDCLLNRLFRPRSKETPKLRVTSLCDANSPATDEFPAQRASNAKNVSICWRHHEVSVTSDEMCLLLDRSLNKNIIWRSFAYGFVKSFWIPITRPYINNAHLGRYNGGLWIYDYLPPWKKQWVYSYERMSFHATFNYTHRKPSARKLFQSFRVLQ